MANQETLLELPAYHQAVVNGAMDSVSADLPNWSGNSAPPSLGDKVVVNVNGIGGCVVIGYQVCEIWLGVMVMPEAPPAWYIKQNGLVPVLAFGAEIG